MMDRFKIDAGANAAEKIYSSFALGVPPEELEQALAGADLAAARLRAARADASGPASERLAAYDKDFALRFAWNSSVMEGCSLAIDQAREVLAGRFSPADEKQRLDALSVSGSASALWFALGWAAAGGALDEGIIKDVHAFCAADIDGRLRGSYRTIPVYISDSLTVPASPDSLRQLMKDLVHACEASCAHPIVKAAAFHALYEGIHPFRDGNGRSGRVLLSAMLARGGYPPICLPADEKPRYIDALEAWQVQGDPAPLVGLIAGKVRDEAETRIAFLHGHC